MEVWLSDNLVPILAPLVFSITQGWRTDLIQNMLPVKWRWERLQPWQKFLGVGLLAFGSTFAGELIAGHDMGAALSGGLQTALLSMGIRKGWKIVTKPES